MPRESFHRSETEEHFGESQIPTDQKMDSLIVAGVVVFDHLAREAEVVDSLGNIRGGNYGVVIHNFGLEKHQNDIDGMDT